MEFAMKRLLLLLVACHWAFGLNPAEGESPAAPAESTAQAQPEANDALDENERKEFKTLLFNAQLGLNRLEITEQQRSDIEKQQESLKKLIGK
jgi:hypothetical protein